MEENSAQHKPFLAICRELGSSAQYRSSQIGLTGFTWITKQQRNMSRSVCRRIWSWEHLHQALKGWVTIPTGPSLAQTFHSSQQSDSIYCVLPAHLLAPFYPPGAESVCSEKTPWWAGAVSGSTHTRPELEHCYGHIHRPPKITMTKYTGDRTGVSNSTSKSFWRSYHHSVLTNRL